MDYIKLLAKNEKEIETLIHAVSIYSQGIGMESWIEKCVLLVIKSGKWHLSEGMKLPNHDKIWTLGEKETYKYMGILKADTIKQVKTKEKIKKEYLRRTRKLPETNLCGRKLVKEQIFGLCLSLDIRDPFGNGREELKQMDHKTNGHAYGITSLRQRCHIICIKKVGRKKTCQNWLQRWDIETTTCGICRKVRRGTVYSHPKRYWKHDDQQNDNN